LSDSLFEELVQFQTEILQDLDLPFRALEMPTSELGMSAARKVDCEVWMPSRSGYGEVSSASHCTDFQAKRLGKLTVVVFCFFFFYYLN
jgi:seryl-tRNA synthetase